jgi:3-oxoacid CoA-transferase A subunit
VDDFGMGLLLKNRQVRKVIASYVGENREFERQVLAGEIEIELVPQGTLAERLRAGGAGIPAFFTPAAVGTPLAEGKESRVFDGKEYLMERWLRADFALIKGRCADTHGNVIYNKTARNFAPIMAMASKVAIVQVSSIVPAGGIDPEAVVTPGIFIDRVVEVAHPKHESELVAAGATYP